MKDNYSWLREIPIEPGVSAILSDEAVTFIATQIEIEKLRARIDTIDFMIAEMILPKNKHGFVKDYLSDLTEKLKELEG